jgi:8-oxo-dGTP diphosphatase
MVAIDWSTWKPKELATLCFVRQGSRVLMIRKKRGLGAGKINGVGGRLEEGETPEIGVVREAREELGITLLDVRRQGELHFQFMDGYSLFCTVFVATCFEGMPIETEEAVPLWFDIRQLPFNEMWEDDELWLRQALAGKFFRGFFLFDGEKMLSDQLEWGEDTGTRHSSV